MERMGSQNWMETQASAKSPLEKLIFDNSDQKLQKGRYPLFLVLSNFTGFFYFFLLPIVCTTKS